MKYILAIFISLLFVACAGVKQGDYVTYTSEDYLFMQDAFINQQMDCIELGEMKQGGLDVKYCVGYNYASALVQGFIFKHNYQHYTERFIGSTLSFQSKKHFTMSCLSETIDDADSGKEYINCMIPQRDFDLYVFIQSSPEDINGQFKAAVGAREVFNGVIDAKGKMMLKNFYKELKTKKSSKWIKRSL